jgi:hypothetical protein
MSESSDRRLFARSRFAGRVGQEAGIAVIRPDPRRATAEELTEYAERRVGKLPDRPSRELLHSELLLLQKEYVRLLRRSRPSQRPPLQAAHELAFDRLEALLDDIDPPLTTKPRTPPGATRRESPYPYGIEVRPPPDPSPDPE